MYPSRALPSFTTLRAAAQGLRPTASRAFALWSNPKNDVNRWEAPPRKQVAEHEIPTNPGPPPPVTQIGVNAILNKNSADLGMHTTPIFAEFSLVGKTAVITGGNRGLGLEVALAYVEAGAHVYVIDLLEEPGDEFKRVAEHCWLMDRQIEYISADVTNEEEINEVMQYIREDSNTGSLDICVACAGVLQTHSALDYDVDKFRETIEVNTTGAFITAQAAARVMKSQEHASGSIILVGSMSGSVANRGRQSVAYNTSKSALLQLCRNLAAEWGPNSIRVNTISPGYVRTSLVSEKLDSDPEMSKRWSHGNPLGRIGKSHEIRGVSVWLGSHASSFCNGSDIIVSGGHTIW